MTPEERHTLERMAGKWTGPSAAGYSDAARAALALLDAQAAELAELRSFLALALRDDESGQAESGAAVERAACAAMLDDEAAECGAKAHVLAMQGASSHPEDMTGATCNRLACAIRARGPALQLPDPKELERLRGALLALVRHINTCGEGIRGAAWPPAPKTLGNLADEAAAVLEGRT